jgi:hypothetical protein
MIIKQTRIPTGQGANLRAYLTSPGENETVENLSGDLINIGFNDMISGAMGLTYSTRHVIISPSERLELADLAKVIEQVCDEFDVPESSRQRLVVVLHEKARSDDNEGARFHYHVAIPEVDDQTGRVLSSSFFKMRNEKLSRLAELTLSHDVIPGRFNREVYTALEGAGVDVRRYKDVLRDACRLEGKPQSGWLDYRARASFSPDTQRAAERKTGPNHRFRSPQAVREHIRGLGRDPAGIISALERDGFEISRGRKPGAWIVSRDGVPFGSLDRLAKLKREAVNEAAEQRYGRPALWDGARSDASRRHRDPGHRARDQGPSGRSGDGPGRGDDGRADTRAADDTGHTYGRARGVGKVDAGAGSDTQRAAQGVSGCGSFSQQHAIRLAAHIRSADALRPAQMAGLRQQLGQQISRGKRRAEVLKTACGLVAGANDGSADYVGIDLEGGFAAAAAFLSKWAAAQARNTRP